MIEYNFSTIKQAPYSVILTNRNIIFIIETSTVFVNTKNREDLSKNDHQILKKPSEKHARFSVANVFNAASKDNGGHIAKSGNAKHDEEVFIL